MRGLIGWAEYQQQHFDTAKRLEVCCCGCHPGPMRERPPRMEHSYYCEECNVEKFLPWTAIVDSMLT